MPSKTKAFAAYNSEVRQWAGHTVDLSSTHRWRTGKKRVRVSSQLCIRVSMVLIRRRHLRHLGTRLFCSTWSSPLPKRLGREHPRWHPLQLRVLTFSGLRTLPQEWLEAHELLHYSSAFLSPSVLHRVTRSCSSHDFQHPKTTVIPVRRKLAYARSYTTHDQLTYHTRDGWSLSLCIIKPQHQRSSNKQYLRSQPPH